MSKGKLVGYGRVSTVGQDNGLETQKQLLLDAGCEKIYFEKITGTSTKQRNELKNALDYIREGDTLVVTKIDRLARSILDLNKMVKELNERGISVRFLKENLEFPAKNDEDDENEKNDNPFQTLLFNILGSFAQFERDIIVERTSEGRERAKAAGKHMGRKGQDKKKIDQALKLHSERSMNGMSISDIVKLTGVPKSTVYAELKKAQS